MKNNTNTSQFHKLTKNDLIFYYQPYKFPTELISQEVSKVGDLIFSLETKEPENAQLTKKKIKLSSCFIIEDELEAKKGFAKRGKITAPFKGKIDNQAWRKAEPEDPGFFDNFKGKSDEIKVFAFKKNLELVEKKEMSISIEKTVLLDHLDLQDQEFFGTKKKENKENKQAKTLVKNNPLVQEMDKDMNKNRNAVDNTQQQSKEILATADDLFSEQGIFSSFGAQVVIGTGKVNKIKYFSVAFAIFLHILLITEMIIEYIDDRKCLFFSYYFLYSLFYIFPNIIMP